MVCIARYSNVFQQGADHTAGVFAEQIEELIRGECTNHVLRETNVCKRDSTEEPCDPI